jgi:hypothetical protein
MKNVRTYLPIISIFGLAVLIRIGYNLTVARHYIPEFDAELYNNLAKHLVTDHCFCYAPNGGIHLFALSTTTYCSMAMGTLG